MTINKPTISELLFYAGFTGLFFGMIYLRDAEALINMRMLVVFTLSLGAAFISSRFAGNVNDGSLSTIEHDQQS